MKVLSTDKGCGMVPVTYEGTRKAQYRQLKNKQVSIEIRNSEMWRNVSRKLLASKEDIDKFKSDMFNVQ
eukprot:11583936-Ditylum_brightwellii.AAC.1